MKTRFNFGGDVEQNAVGLGFWTRAELSRRSDDIYLTLTEQTAKNPGLVTKKLYGRENLTWLLFQYNNIIDPIRELVAGKTIVLPHPVRIL